MRFRYRPSGWSAFRRWARAVDRQQHSHAQAALPGPAYEQRCASILRGRGWDVRVTAASGDQGCDLLASSSANLVAIQCKSYAQPVGNAAVQEVYAARAHYGASAAAVVTEAGYTPSAQALARSTETMLLSSEQLSSLDRLLGGDTSFFSTVTERVSRRCRCGVVLRLPMGRTGKVRCPCCGLWQLHST